MSSAFSPLQNPLLGRRLGFFRFCSLQVQYCSRSTRLYVPVRDFIHVSIGAGDRSLLSSWILLRFLQQVLVDIGQLLPFRFNRGACSTRETTTHAALRSTVPQRTGPLVHARQRPAVVSEHTSIGEVYPVRVPRGISEHEEPHTIILLVVMRFPRYKEKRMGF